MAAGISPIRLARLSLANKRLVAEALVAVATASIAIRLASFRSVVEKAGAVGPASGDREQDRREAFRCSWAVERVAGLVPWRTVCFQKGLALHRMLRRRGVPSILHYGVGKQPEKGLAAHVWVSVDGWIVMGGDVAHEFRELASFPASAAAGSPS